ncbi:hypothetical protein NDU88_002226 [Pleurodeles waltl]|uniref:Uncharacterized protein n=1 Tax=Pleurodeles waltl TaxID=8319 RepID=A0AAV7LI84_PLEWA|nr:hypothetical protein NDU88_002226 [Pleurodeles waltl]
MGTVGPARVSRCGGGRPAFKRSRFRLRPLSWQQDLRAQGLPNEAAGQHNKDFPHCRGTQWAFKRSRFRLDPLSWQQDLGTRSPQRSSRAAQQGYPVLWGSVTCFQVLAIQAPHPFLAAGSWDTESPMRQQGSTARTSHIGRVRDTLSSARDSGSAPSLGSRILGHGFPNEAAGQYNKDLYNVPQ